MSNSVPQSYIPATRINIGLMPADDELWEFTNYFDLSHSEALNGTYIQKAIDSLYGESAFSSDLVLGEQLWIALGHGFSCAKSICQEIIQDGPHPHLETGYDEKHGRTVDTHHGMGIGTIDDIRGTPLYARVLSSGTQGTLLWIYVLALRIAGHYGWEEGWEKKPAILLIDEIENHLHPTWQRRVIPALLEHFPGLQIFATTHSPFMVAGLKAGQVHLLKRDTNGVVTATTNERDVIGWTADEILRTIMGVDEPTDQLTVDRANRLRQLREKETLTPEEESELNALRRQVNKDLMSKGGPLEAQRERYAELMERFLLSRQSDLTQDGE